MKKTHLKNASCSLFPAYSDNFCFIVYTITTIIDMIMMIPKKRRGVCNSTHISVKIKKARRKPPIIFIIIAPPKAYNFFRVYRLHNYIILYFSLCFKDNQKIITPIINMSDNICDTRIPQYINESALNPSIIILINEYKNI